MLPVQVCVPIPIPIPIPNTQSITSTDMKLKDYVANNHALNDHVFQSLKAVFMHHGALVVNEQIIGADLKDVQEFVADFTHDLCCTGEFEALVNKFEFMILSHLSKKN
jgi:hypothetical protein